MFADSRQWGQLPPFPCPPLPGGPRTPSASLALAACFPTRGRLPHAAHPSSSPKTSGERPQPTLSPTEPPQAPARPLSRPQGRRPGGGGALIAGRQAAARPHSPTPFPVPSRRPPAAPHSLEGGRHAARQPPVLPGLGRRRLRRHLRLAAGPAVGTAQPSPAPGGRVRRQQRAPLRSSPLRSALHRLCAALGRPCRPPGSR